MRKYSVNFTRNYFMNVEVEAESEEEAILLAKQSEYEEEIGFEDEWDSFEAEEIEEDDA